MKPLSVMIIDDNEADQYILKRLLKKAGLARAIFDAPDGRSALEFLSRYDDKARTLPDDFPPEIIFLDINMPHMNGFEFLEKFSELAEEHAFDSTIVMMVTSSGNPADMDRAKSCAHVKGYIVKMPENADELAKAVAEALDAQR